MADNLQPELPNRAPVADAAAQNKSGIVMPPEDVGDASSALDEAFKEVTGREPTQDDNTPVRDREKNAETEIAEATELSRKEGDEPEGDEPAAGEQKPAAEEKPAPAPAPEPEGNDLLENLLGKQEKPTEQKPTEQKSEEDPYKDLKLRADASERTKTTFEDLKRTAREREAKAREEAERFRKEAEEAKKAADEAKKAAEEAAKKANPEIEKELKELREWRAAYDTENDPEFNKKFSERRERNNTTIFEALQRNGLKPEVVEQVKKLPYDQQVEQIARWADKLPPRDKFAVNSRLADNENLESERAAALAEVKAKAAEILASKKEAPAKNQEVFVKEAVETLKPIIPQLSWLHVKEIPATASEKEKTDLTQHNAKAIEAQKQLLGFLQDDSARTRSLTALAGILAPRYRADLQTAQVRIAALEKELGAIKEAGRISKTSRSSGTAAAAAPKVDLFETSADDAMEEAWKRMNGGNL